MDASSPEQDIAYRRIHGLEARMSGSGHRGLGDGPRCCAWLVRLCRCFSGDSDDSQETTPRSRALENHLYQYEAPAVSPSSGVIVQQQRATTSYEDEADAGPLLPKTAESSAQLPRPGHSRNNSSASTAPTAAPGAASLTPAGAGGGGGEGLGPSKRPGSLEAANLGPGPESGVLPGPAGTGAELPYRSGAVHHHRSGSYGEAGKPPRWGKGEAASGAVVSETSTSGSANAPAGVGHSGTAAHVAAVGLATATASTGGHGVAAAAALVGAAATATASSTAAGRPGAVFGPMQDEDDDFCPTCLDAYTEENPKIFTECGHHFHMPCIYAWLERKDTCPMCESPMQAPGM